MQSTPVICFMEVAGVLFLVLFLCPHKQVCPSWTENKKGWLIVMKQTKTPRIHSMVECALLIALGYVLSYIPLFRMPHGGSITMVSMAPILLIGFRQSPRWALLSSFAYSLVQLLFGVQNLAYCQSLAAVAGCILLDFVLGFTILGLAGWIGRLFPWPAVGVACGSFLVCLMRYLCSFVSGYLVWRDYDYAVAWLAQVELLDKVASLGESAVCWIYSALYNASYMLPETVITCAAMVVLYLLMPWMFKRVQKKPVDATVSTFSIL